MQFAASQITARGVEKRAAVVVKAEKEVSRRSAIALGSGIALLAAGVPSDAKRVADGDLPVFGNSGKKVLGFIPYEGDGFKMDIPAEWEPSKEVEDDAQLIRYEDHFDVVTNLLVLKEKTGKSSIKDYGSPSQFLSAYGPTLFGVQTWNLPTDAEGGFKSGKTAAASLMEVSDAPDANTGVPTYFFETLVRTADGDEGGRHFLIKAAVKNGNLYVLRLQSGDKRWIR